MISDRDDSTSTDTGQRGGSKQRQRTGRPPSWKDQPAFLDASASISVATFGARRLVELEQLYHQSSSSSSILIQPEHVAFQSGGGQTSSRHLRRRTTSHQSRRHRHRFPTTTTATHAANITTKSSQTRKAKRSSSGLLCQGHHGWHNTSRALLIPQPTLASDDRPTSKKNAPLLSWMMTHLWHAKRFRMESLWGWRVPVAHTNRGGRAVLRLTSSSTSSSSSQTKTTTPATSTHHHCTLQDLTFSRQPVSIRFSSRETSSSSSKDQFLKCIARILPEWNNLDPNILRGMMLDNASSNNPVVTTTRMMGEGMLHHMDQFPRGAIGPTWWHVTTTTQYSADDSDECSRKQWNYHLHFRVHPSIHSTALNCLQELQLNHPQLLELIPHKNIDDDDDNNKSQLPLCCFQIGGANATDMVQDIFHPRPSPDLDVKEWNWKTLVTENKSKEDDVLSSLRHGSIVRVVMDLLQSTSNDTSCGKTKSANVVLVHQKPRPLDCDANRAVSGWDLYCDPDQALAIWTALALKCVVIGVVEQSHLHLECEPPIPNFPRDFIDTEESRRYWASSNDVEKEENDWSLIRKLYESGWGRLPTKKTVPLANISWERLVDSRDGGVNEELKLQNPDTVIVRGAFGQPFLAALEGCGQLIRPSNDTNPISSVRRRKRRRSTAPNTAKQAQSLSKEQREKWRQMVQTLLDNLSLPAALQAHIRVAGRGTLQSGGEVFVGDSFCGFVTTGSFSPSRGMCHGLAILGAARLLQALVCVDDSASLGRVVRLSSGTNQIQLRGSLRQAPGTHSYVTISLLL